MLPQAAMAETMTKSHNPTEQILNAYKAWGKGGWGGIITGTHPCPPSDLS
jgi:2,4-dienoyl-CoA reductase-like NADH-dependent reductase (Old Yellow Enzyme family)